MDAAVATIVEALAQSVRNIDHRLREVSNRETDKYIIPVGRHGDLQAALDRADNNGGGTVVLAPDTVYVAETTFTVGDYTTIRGSGGSVLQRHASLTSQVLRNKGYVLGVGWGTQNRGIVIRDLSIDGANGGSGAWVDGRDLLLLSACYDSLIDNVFGYSALNDGFILEFCATTTIRDSRLSSNRKAGIYIVGCDVCSVISCSSQANDSHGIAVQYSWYCTVRDCVSFGNVGNAGIVTGRGTRYCTFTDNRIAGLVVAGEPLGTVPPGLLGPNEAARLDNPYVRDGSTLYGIDDCLIANNQIARNTVSAGLSLYLSSRNTVVDNEVAYNEGPGFITTGGKDNLVARNRFIANCMGGAIVWAMAAVQADAGAGVPATVYATGNVFDDNDLSDPQGVPTQTGALVLTPANSVDNIARRNRARNVPFAAQIDAVSLLEENIGFGVPVQALVAGTTIHPYGKIVPISSVGNITLTSTPTMTNGYYDGQRCVLHNVGANTITVQDRGTLGGSNLRLTAGTLAIGPEDTLELVYSANKTDWVQASTVIAIL